jgi:hypothetical protein
LAIFDSVNIRHLHKSDIKPRWRIGKRIRAAKANDKLTDHRAAKVNGLE